jgi:hypothetical protein
VSSDVLDDVLNGALMVGNGLHGQDRKILRFVGVSNIGLGENLSVVDYSTIT